jgi:hypothetical protein
MIRTRFAQISGIALGALLFSMILTAWLTSIAHGATLDPVTVPVPPIETPVPTWMTVLTVLIAAVVGADMAVRGLAAILRAISTHTVTKVDDNAANALDSVHARLVKIEELLGGIAKPGTLMLGLLLFSMALSGCATVKTVPAATASAVVDCTKQDGGPLLTLALDFTKQILVSLTGGAKIDWDGLETQAEHEGTAIGECAFVEVWSRLHPTAPSTDPVPTLAARSAEVSALDRMRAHAGGVQFKLSDGSLK